MSLAVPLLDRSHAGLDDPAQWMHGLNSFDMEDEAVREDGHVIGVLNFTVPSNKVKELKQWSEGIAEEVKQWYVKRSSKHRFTNHRACFCATVYGKGKVSSTEIFSCRRVRKAANHKHRTCLFL